jgi:hypothetical protein
MLEVYKVRVVTETLTLYLVNKKAKDHHNQPIILLATKHFLHSFNHLPIFPPSFYLPISACFLAHIKNLLI